MYWNVYWRPLCWEDKYIKHQVYLCKMASSYYLWILEYLQVQLFPNASRLIYSGIIYLNHTFFLSVHFHLFSVNQNVFSQILRLFSKYQYYLPDILSSLLIVSPNYQYYLPAILSSLLKVSPNFQDYLQTTNAIS